MKTGSHTADLVIIHLASRQQLNNNLNKVSTLISIIPDTVLTSYLPFHSTKGRGNNEQYWWQGSQSPFSEGAAQNRGVSSGARAIDTSRAHARPLVPGCGGGKCFGASAHSAVASSSNGGQQYLPPSAASSSVQGSHQSQNL